MLPCSGQLHAPLPGAAACGSGSAGMRRLDRDRARRGSVDRRAAKRPSSSARAEARGGERRVRGRLGAFAEHDAHAVGAVDDPIGRLRAQVDDGRATFGVCANCQATWRTGV
jgi:hypothetical protein